MSILPMYKRCVYCWRKYTYNPSVGDFGEVCKFCGRLQTKGKNQPKLRLFLQDKNNNMKKRNKYEPER